MIRTTLFTYADPLYELFVLPYIVTALIYNDDVRVEICVDDAEDFNCSHAQGFEILARHFGNDRFMVRDAEKTLGVSPNSVRFLESPRIMTEFTYIGDIDILILESISSLHMARIEQSGIPYSNIKRPGQDRLTGLHFTRSDAYYPVKPPPDADRVLDEHLLYKMVLARGHPLPPKKWTRPIHGYHISPNRSPLRRIVDGKQTPHWAIGNPAHVEAYQSLQKQAIWKSIYPCFDRRYRLLLGLLDLALSSKYGGYKMNENGQVTGLLTDLPLIKNIVENP